MAKQTKLDARGYRKFGTVDKLAYAAGAACFLPFPNAPEFAKGILFVAGYVFWDAFYTVANVPYGSMLSLITDDAGERAQLSSWRTAGSMIAGICTGALIPVMIYDAANELRGEQMWIIALVMGIAGFIAFQFLHKKTEIRVEVKIDCNEDAPKFNVFTAIKNFCRNRPALGATLQFVGVKFVFNLDKNTLAVMNKELEERRAAK